jgi:hypothetical protein
VTLDHNKLERLSVEIIFKFAKSSLLTNTLACYVFVKVFNIIASSLVHVMNLLIPLLIMWQKKLECLAKTIIFDFEKCFSLPKLSSLF